MKKIQKIIFISIFLFAAGILASAETYTWTGAVDGVFTNPNNWKDSSNNTPTWGSILPAATYKISNTPSRIPYLPNNVTLAAGTTKIEVGTNSTSASLILGDFSFGGSVTIRVNEKGTLGLSGTPAQITLFNNLQIILKPDSTVWYYGGYNNNIFPGPYQNFKVTGNINADSLTVEKTTSIGNSNPVTIKVKTQTYKGAVTVQKDVTFDAETSVTFTAAANVNAGTQNLSFIGGGAVNMQGVTAGTVDATGALSLTVNGTVNLSGDLKAKNLTVNTATVSAAKIEVNQAATVNTAATITAPTQTYMDAVTVNANTTINASSNLTFGSDGTVGGTGSIIVSGNGTVNIQKNINLTGSTSKFEQTGTGAVNIGVNASSITAAAQIYTGAVTINADTEFNTSTALTFKNTVSGYQKITLSGIGNVNIGNNITLTGNNGIIEQTGSGSITIDGSLSSVPLTPPVKINAYEQTYQKSVTINTDTEFHAETSVKFLSNISAVGKNIGFWGQSATTQAVNAGTMTSHASERLTLNGAVNLSGSLYTGSNTYNSSVTGERDIEVNGTWQHSGTGNITAKGNVKAGTFTQMAADSTLVFGGSTPQTLQIGPASQIQNLENNGNLKLNSDITIIGKFENNGTFDATTSLSPPAGYTVTLTNGADHTITGTGNAGNTKFHNLSLTGAGGKTLTINGKISVNGILKLEGTNAGSLLTIAGGTNSPGIKLSADQANGKWLNVHTNIPMIPESGGKTYTVTESKDHEVSGFLISDGHPKNWIFSSYAGPMTWKGNHSSNWSDWQNWRPYGIPGVNSDVTIPQKEAAAHYPKLTANVSAKSVTVNSGAELDLDGYLINTTGGTAKLINKGHLKLTGTTGQKNWFENANDANKMTVEANSIVEYYGNTPATSNIWAGPYQNLRVSGATTGFTTEDLKVNEYFTVNTTDSFIINADSQLYTKMVTLNKPTTFSSTNADGTVFKSYLKTNGNAVGFSGTGKIETKDDVYGYGNITVNTGTGAWNSSGKIEANIINTHRNWTSTKDVTANSSITATDWTAKNVTLKGNLTAVQFNQTAGTLTFNGTGTPEQELKFTGAGDKKINHLTIDTGAKVKLGSEIEVKGTFLNNGTFNANNKNIILNGFCTNSGTFNTGTSNTITFKGASFTNSGTFTAGATNTVTLNPTGSTVTITGTGTASATTFRNLSLTGAGGKTLTITGNISVNGNLTLQGSGAADAQLLTIDGNASGSGIALSAANTAIGKYLKVRTNIHITTDSHKYQADSSKPYTVSGDPEIGINNPKNWIFDDCLIEMKWLGGSGTTDSEKTAWSAPKNWLPNGIPGIHTPVKIESGKTYYPKLTANVKAKTITLNGELDLDSYTISDDAGGTSRSHIDNKGKLKMTGTAGSPTDQKTWLEIPTSNIGDCITHNDSSIVEYYGSTNNNVWKGPYKNLSLNNRPDLKTNNENLIVNGVLTVTGSGIHIKTGTGTQTYNGIIAATGKDITLEGSTITTKHNITANNIKVLGDWNSNSGNITAGTNIEAAKWNSKQGSITAGADIIVTGDWYSERSIISGINITSSGSKWTSWGGITATGNIDIENELAFTGGRITVGGNLAAKKLNAYSDAYSGGLIFFNGSGTRKLSGAGGNNIIDGKIQNLEIKSGVTLKLESDITITVGLNNQGEFDAVTKSKKVRLVHATGLLTPPVPPNNITIKGNTSAVNTKFHNLECTNAGGKKLTINGKISVNGDLKLEGTNDGSLLTIEGGTNSSGIQLAASQTGNGKWLNVHTNIPMTPETGGKTYTVTESKAHEVPGFLISDGHPKNWIFNDYIGSMSWTALESLDADKTKWDKSKNWIPNGIPGTHTKVNIPTGINKYPKLENSTNAKAEKIALNGELDLAGYVITDTLNTAPLTNNGLLKMTGTADQKTWFENSSSNDKITLGDNSTVQYDSGSSANVFSGPYENLILNGSITAASSLTVNKKTTVNTAATITAPAQTYGGDVAINANTTFSASNSITFSQAIEAAANNVTFDGTGIINTQAVTAGNITLNLNIGAWTSSGVINSSGDITVNNGSGAWTSSGAITAQNITVDRNWTSSGDVTAAGNITAKGWTANNVSLKRDLTAARFNQMTGTLTFNGTGTPEQKLNFTGTGNKNINNLTIDNGSTPNANLKLLSDITIKRDFTNKGTFNADTHTVTLTNDADHKIIGTDTAGDTKFYNLFCEDAGDKTLTFENKIWVEEKMYLSGSYSTGIKPLNIDGNGVVSLNNNHPIPGNVSITNIRQKFLRVFSNKVKIGNNKYYGTDESTDDQGTTKNNNGWVFYKTFELVNSFAIPGKNEIYLLFKNGSANNVYTELTEADLANPNFTPLIITDGSSHVYAENRLYIPERLPLPSAIKEHTFWKFTLNNSISPDWILNQNALISLDYYDRKKQKLHISDIGIDMITPQRASNSIVLRSFDASEDDKALPRLDVTILAEKKGASNNAQLYFYSKDSAEHKLWHPGTVPIGPPPRFAVPQAGTTNYGCTLENNLLKSIISEQDVHLEPNKVGGFMYIYDGWLPCARLRNSNDILSFDVWHFKIVGVQKQKGGVSIFDNVLDPYKGQETIIAAHLQKPGMLTIQIMSLDGSIIRTIERSYKAAGDHIYFWDGKNNGGNPVARGIYFVRIAGPDIDEIRKILVVKN